MKSKRLTIEMKATEQHFLLLYNLNLNAFWCMRTIKTNYYISDVLFSCQFFVKTIHISFFSLSYFIPNFCFARYN